MQKVPHNVKSGVVVLQANTSAKKHQGLCTAELHQPAYLSPLVQHRAVLDGAWEPLADHSAQELLETAKAVVLNQHLSYVTTVPNNPAGFNKVTLLFSPGGVYQSPAGH